MAVLSGDDPVALLGQPVPADGVEVWLIPLAEENPAGAENLLSPDELGRAARFVTQELRRDFIRARAAMRLLLGERLGRPPADLVFTYGPSGKPALSGAKGLHFNLSHSRRWALLAITRLGPVGVDIEWCRGLSDRDDLAARFFAPTEVDMLMGLPETQRDQAFFAGWTRKEAYLKALGSGFSVPLDSFAVEIRPGYAPRLLSASAGQRTGDWLMRDIDVPPGYRGALVVAAAGADCRVRSLSQADFRRLLDGALGAGATP